MLTVEEAVRRLRDDSKVVSDTASVPVKEALGLVLANDIVASIDVPPADNSAMDGYAFCVDESLGNQFQ